MYDIPLECKKRLIYLFSTGVPAEGTCKHFIVSHENC